MLLKKRRPVEGTTIDFVRAPGGVKQQLSADEAALEGVAEAAARLRQTQVLQVPVNVVLHGHDAPHLRVREPAAAGQPRRVPHDVPEARHAHAVALLFAAVNLLSSPCAGLGHIFSSRILIQKLPLPGMLLLQLPVDVLHQPLGSLGKLRAAIVYTGPLGHALLVLLAHVEEIQEEALTHGSLARQQSLQLLLHQSVHIWVVRQADLVQVPRQSREPRD
mmetsp:Transcript_113264/g.353047  ORF Transcript_113264/g.353047 Transcript_113264/m.353047 type:complete len:219 (+) Transcript_113264:773-1429(+)